MDREEGRRVLIHGFVDQEGHQQGWEDEEDEQPLPFNSRRSVTTDIKTTVDSPAISASTSPNPRLSSRSRLDVLYEASLFSDELADVLQTESVGFAPTKREDSEWESESLDGFIVIESDSENEVKARSRKREARVAHHDLDSCSIIGQEAQNWKESTSMISVSRNPNCEDQRRTLRKILSEIEDTEDLKLLYPASLQDGVDTRRDQHRSEPDALNHLIPMTIDFDQSYIELEIRDFSIYRTLDTSKEGFSNQFSGQFEHLLTASAKNIECLVDGVLQDRDQHCYVEGMKLTSVIIGNLDDPTTVSTKGNIFLVTFQSGQQQTRYRMVTPSDGYKEYFNSFTWITDLTKHVFHYLAAKSEEGYRVRLADFATDFWKFIRAYSWSKHQQKELEDWHAMCAHITDFQKHIIRYGGFVRDQALTVITSGTFEALFAHEFWHEIGQSEEQLKKRTVKYGSTTVTKQVAAPFLQSFPDWGKEKFDLLEILTLTPTVENSRDDRCHRLCFPRKTAVEQNHTFTEVDGKKYPRTALVLEQAACAISHPTLTAAQVEGMAVILRYQDRYRYAYVRSVVDESRIKVVWLLHAGQTMCGSFGDGTHYPIGNELFFSDECSCLRIRCQDVLASYGMTVFGEQALRSDGFFVNMMYRPEEQVFCTVSLDQINDCLRCNTHTDPPGSTSHSPVKEIEMLSLFSGCGLLDHGLASAGNFKTTVAVEIDSIALLSHKANTPNDCDHVCTSTNDHLAAIATGKQSYGQYHLIAAGCPCKGYSTLNAHRNTKEAQRNCSMLANTLSYVDLLRPEYVLIENVKAMDHGNATIGKANACAQAICCLIAMGYQVRKMILEGANYDAATKRERLFLVAAAPCLQLPEVPATVEAIIPNSAYSALEGLDVVHNDTTVNIKAPDHIPFERLRNNFSAGVSLRNIVRRVPVVKHGRQAGDDRSLYGAWKGGHLTRRQRQWFSSLTDEKQSRSSGALRRVDPEGLFTTITRQYIPLNSRAGAFIHPHQHRVVTCEELRRAQGVPHDFVLIGTTKDAISQVGNGVVWQVAQALGKSIQEAWSTSQLRLTRRNEEGKDVCGRSRAGEQRPETPRREAATWSEWDKISRRMKQLVKTPIKTFKTYEKSPMLQRPEKTPERPFECYGGGLSTPQNFERTPKIPTFVYEPFSSPVPHTEIAPSNRLEISRNTSTVPSLKDPSLEKDDDDDIRYLGESPVARPHEHSNERPIKKAKRFNGNEWA